MHLNLSHAAFAGVAKRAILKQIQAIVDTKIVETNRVLRDLEDKRLDINIVPAYCRAQGRLEVLLAVKKALNNDLSSLNEL